MLSAHSQVFPLTVEPVIQHIYQKLRKISSRGIGDKLFCNLSFSLCHGWMLGLVFLASFEGFGIDAATTPVGIGTKISILFSL